MPDRPPSPRGWLLARAFVHIFSLASALLLLAYWGLSWLPEPPRLVIAISIMLHLLFWPVLLALLISILLSSRLGLAASGLALALLVLAYAPLFLPPYSGSGALQAGVSGPTLRVMTFNTCISQGYAAPVIEQIEAFNPDLVALQEFYPHKNEGVSAALKERYPYQDWSKPYGLLSRYPLSNCRFDAFVEPVKISGWVQGCEVSLDGRRLSIYNAHLRPPVLVLPGKTAGTLALDFGLDTASRDGDLRALQQVIGSHPGPYLVLGDLNLGDMEPAHRRLPAQWIDSFWEIGWGIGASYHRPSLPFLTWRIDYIFHTPELAALSAENGWFSEWDDHRPVIVDLGFK